MKVYDAAAIRNVAVVGHGGCGKTQLVSAMLFGAGDGGVKFPKLGGLGSTLSSAFSSASTVICPFLSASHRSNRALASGRMQGRPCSVRWRSRRRTSAPVR